MGPRPTVRQLEYLVAVADALHFRRAAHTPERVVRPFADPAPGRTVGLVYRSASGRDREMRMLRDVLREAAGTIPR